MYDELVKRLREHNGWALNETLDQAADAIESMRKRVPKRPHGALMDRDDFFATCPELVDGYKRITDDLVVIPEEEGE